MRRKAQELAKSAICVAFLGQSIIEGATLPPINMHPDFGLLVPCLKFAESGPC